MKESDQEAIRKKLYFLDKWFLPETEIPKRKNLIRKLLKVYEGVSPMQNDILAHPKISSLVTIADLLAHLKPISDYLLCEFVFGLTEFALYIATNEESHLKVAYDLMSESVTILSTYYETDEYAEYLISKKVTGDERFESEGIIVPFSPKSIFQHAKRMALHPLTSKDIDKVKSDFAKYNRQLYYQPINNGTKEKFPLKENSILLKIHTISKDRQITDLDLPDFLSAIRDADFTDIKTKPEYKIQHLIFTISKIMGENWYSAVIKSVGWKKSQCGGHREKLENDSWGSDINQIISDLEKGKGKK